MNKQDAIFAKLKSLLDVANRHYGTDIKLPTTIKFTKRGTTAGTHTFRFDRFDSMNTYDHQLNFNMHIANENWDTFIERTPGHELAHFISVTLYGSDNGKGHGRRWKEVMSVIGHDDKRCHNYDLSNVAVKRKKRFEYQCGCPGKVVNLTSVRHNRIVRGQRTYSCTVCRTTLTRKVQVTNDYEQVAKALAPTLTQQKPAAKRPSNKKPAATTGTKAEQAETIVSANVSRGRQWCINHIMEECSMSKAGASTYYYNAKKKLGL